jgi:hypothetical protein
MADRSPHTTSADPFADRPRQTHFVEPQRSLRSQESLSTLARPYDSTSNLGEFGGSQGGQYDDEEERQPLNIGQDFTGGFYPPPCVVLSFPASANCHTVGSIQTRSVILMGDLPQSSLLQAIP